MGEDGDYIALGGAFWTRAVFNQVAEVGSGQGCFVTEWSSVGGDGYLKNSHCYI